MSWKAVAITLCVLLATAIVGAAALTFVSGERRYDPYTDKRSDNPNWHDHDKPYVGPNGVVPNPPKDAPAKE